MYLYIDGCMVCFDADTCAVFILTFISYTLRHYTFIRLKLMRKNNVEFDRENILEWVASNDMGFDHNAQFILSLIV